MDIKEYEAEKALLKALDKHDLIAFISFYKDYGEDLMIFAFGLLDDINKAELLVEKLFDRLFAEANFGSIEPPIHQFLIAEIRKLHKRE